MPQHASHAVCGRFCCFTPVAKGRDWVPSACGWRGPAHPAGDLAILEARTHCVLSLFSPRPSAFPEAEQADLRPEEPHLRLRHGLHHQRHADRSQSDPAERHGVAASRRRRAVASSPRMCMPRGQTAPPHRRSGPGDDADVVQLSKEPRVAVQPGSRDSTSSPWQGHQRAVFNALMVLFPNAINSQEFRILLQPPVVI